MIPIRDENPTRTVPYVVYLLIVVNVLVFIIDEIGGRTVPPGVEVGTFWDYSMVPRQVVTGNPDIPVQIRTDRAVVTIPHNSPSPVWITILTSMFLHGGLLHIGGNMLYLWIFGNNIEDVLGHTKFLIFYLLGGFAAAVAHIVSAPMSQVPTVGASGAIAATLGAYVVLYPNSRVICLVFLGFFVTTVAVPAVVVLGLWIVLQVLNAAAGGGMTPGGGGVAYWAHIGGFAVGVAGILLLGGQRLIRGRRGRNYQNYWSED
ncbi:MAG: rhomboid family intramembrane serine protease [Armatimonadetes bacterium]|nr:rhomboid family intramembrane serine protease [Armatimonadota bacterium]